MVIHVSCMLKLLKEGLKSHANAIKTGLTQSVYETNQLINWYSKNGLTKQAHKLFDEMSQRNVYSWNAIINAYIKPRHFKQAQELFDTAPCRDAVTYNVMISAYAQTDGYENVAMDLFVKMQGDDDTARMDEFTLTTMLNLVAKIKVLGYGKQLHSFMVKSGNDFSGFALSSLIDMYSKSGSFRDAFEVINGNGKGGWVDLVVKNAMVAACCREGELEMALEMFLSEPVLNDTVSWNTMISGYVQNGRDEKAIELFQHMPLEGYCWNEHTVASILSICSTRRNLRLGKEVHAWVLKEGMCANSFISSGIVDVYSKCGNMRYAETVHNMVGRGDNLFSVTSMIVGFSAKGQMSEARRLFDLLLEKNFVVWTAIISGYVKFQHCEEAFVLFREYVLNEKEGPDPVILVSLLSACGIRASVDPGKQIHAYILRNRIKMDEKAVSALVDMYSKCGSLSYAKRIFRRSTKRDTVIYNVMIAGFAHHGYEYEAIHLFEEMIEQKLRPDTVTFIALLSACRHSGQIEAAEKYFLSMTKDYAIEPEIDHYSCMVDLYGRSNNLEKAVAFMEKMPFEPDSVLLSAFLNACRNHKNLELAKIAEKKLLEIEGDNGSRYFQLASVYALGGNWEEKGRMMRTMRGKEAKKIAGCSWVHVGSGVHVFISGDRSHSETEAVYCALGCLIYELCDTDSVDEIAQILI